MHPKADAIGIACRIRAQAAEGCDVLLPQREDVTVQPINNRLLRSLNKPDLDLLLPHMTPVELTLRRQLEAPGQPVSHVYFIESGQASVVAHAQNKAAEAAVVGWEGLTGSFLALGGDQSPLETMVQIAGAALQMDAHIFLKAIDSSPSLRRLVSRFARALSIQTAYTCLANARTRLDARLARWLLMVHDRTDGDRFEITHEFLSVMLAVRRPGVPVALQELEGKLLIRSTRGVVTIRDREGLIEAADGVYTIAEREYERLTGTKLMRESLNADDPH